MATNKELLEALLKIQGAVSTVDKNVAVQGAEIKNLHNTVIDMKQEQTRQNVVVEKHEKRSNTTEARMEVIEEQHHIFKEAHEDFKTRITKAEQPSLIIRNIWRALLTLGAGAGAMYAILRLLDQIRP